MTIAVEGPGPQANASESELTEAGDKLFERRGYKTKKFSSSLNARDGFPQRLYVKGDHAVMVEYMDSTGKPSKNQAEWAERFEHLEAVSGGAITMMWVRPQDWTELVKVAV